jgi:cyanophycinase
MPRIVAAIGVLMGAWIGPSLGAQEHGPANGTLVISGGNTMPSSHIIERFIELAGGPEAPIVVVPTSGGLDKYDETCPCVAKFREAGARNVKILHTRDRSVANSDAFVEPLRKARGVWFEEGNAWRHQDAYLDTKVHRELFALLDRGGVIGGGSAGARIQSDYIPVRGVEPAERAIPQSDWRRGFRLVRNVILDVHVLVRNRQFDMIGLINAHPQMLGIAMDENTAIVVRGDKFDVIGTSIVIVYDNQRQVPPEQAPGEQSLNPATGLFYFLRAGDSYDMKTRKATRPGSPSAFDRVVERSWKSP